MQMDSLNRLYATLLARGLVLLREAIRSHDEQRAEAEVQFLHNVPTLLDEPNIERHRYFWNVERVAYIEWASKPGHELAAKRVGTYYEPLWQEMEPLLRDLFSNAQSANDAVQA